MATSTAPEMRVLTDASVWRARSEAHEIAMMLEYRDDEMARTAHLEPPMLRQNERSAIAMAIGEATGLSEGQVQGKLSAADTVRDQSPITWDAFVSGRIDFIRVRDIAATIDKLKRADSIHRLDRRVVGYATGHTAAELRAWLRRFINRVEADLAVERADHERQNRHVSIRHGDDSMGFLNAYLAAHELAEIEALLHAGARKDIADGDTRTAAQREADLLVDWCLSTGSRGEGGDARSSSANIAVTIDADVLAGAVAGFAESTDGAWAVPAWWMTDVIATGSTFWHRIVTDPVTKDVLSHEYLGRFAPDILDVALQFLHGVCQAPGCMVPAGRCDQDHRIPHPEGPTTAANMGPLCRRHHIFKGHGILKWSTLKTNSPPPLVIEIYTSPVNAEYFGA